MFEKYGKYKVLPKFGEKNNGPERFGSGGLGEVFLAENIEEKGKKYILYYYFF